MTQTTKTNNPFNLSIEQINSLPLYAAKWSSIGRSTQPANRNAAENALNQCYTQAGYEKPEHIIWCDSPFEGARRAAELALREKSIMPDLYDWAKLYWPLDDFQHGWALSYDPLWKAFETLLIPQIHKYQYDASPDDTENIPQFGGGQTDAAWLWVCDFLGTELQLEEIQSLTGLIGMAKSCGGWWAFENTAIICERPSRIELDKNDLLHSETHPAIQYLDESGIYVFHGSSIPAFFIEDPRQLEPADIQDENITPQLRRFLIKHYGYERYMKVCEVPCVDRDELGELFVLNLPNDEPIKMVKIRYETAEIDGSHAESWLRVPPYTQTVQEAVNWVFSIDSSQYQPAA